MLGTVGVRYGAVWQAGLGGFQHGGVRSGMAGTAGCGTTGSSVAWWGKVRCGGVWQARLGRA